MVAALFMQKTIVITLLGFSALNAPAMEAVDVPATLKRKKRPGWYMAEISTVIGYEASFVYAGAEHTGWCYHMF